MSAVIIDLDLHVVAWGDVDAHCDGATGPG